MNHPRVFVAGSSGLLGSTFLPFLKSRDYDVVGLKTDLSQRKSAWTLLDEVAPNVIINLAASANVDECENKPSLAFQKNVQIPFVLAEWVHFHPGTHLIQISTDMIYNTPGLNTESSLKPCNVYACTKYAGELAAGQATVLRTNFFGHSQKPGRQSLSDWLLQSFRNQTSIQLLKDVFFSPLSLRTLSEMIELCIQKRPLGTFNLGSREGFSKADFARKLAEAFEFKIEGFTRDVTLADLGLKAPRPQHMLMDVSKFEKTLGVQLPTLKQEILKLREN